jgi:putative phosphoribosyl transferase
MGALFADRTDAGERLAELLRVTGDYPAGDTVVLGLPRGGVPVARKVADALGAPLDVLAVRKLGSPRHPEFAVGAIGENGVRIVDDEAVRLMGLNARELRAVEEREGAELARRLERYRSGRPRLDLTSKHVIVVDDGVATGATATVACRVARALGATSVTLAVPVAPADWGQRLAAEADSLVAVATPRDFWAVGQFYRRFDQTSDAEVISCLRSATR